MQALETVYNGCHFRSRLEARWATVFDALELRWEYETEGFDLEAAGWYVSDFYLPDVQRWVEIKPVRPTPQDIAKAQALCLFRREAVMVFVGLPSPDEFLDQHPEQVLFITPGNDAHPPGDMIWGALGWYTIALIKPPYEQTPLTGYFHITGLLEALAAARTARVDGGALRLWQS